MSSPNDTGAVLYEGEVVHARLVPRPHKLRYRVTSLLVDLASLPCVSNSLCLFGYNTPHLMSFYDRDHGAGKEQSAFDYARMLFNQAGLADAGARVKLLCYPRLLGYVFNPVSVYYGFDGDNKLRGLIYEVNNTYRERRSYVLAAGESRNGVYAHACGKEMSVSPFTSNDGRYNFNITQPGDDLLLGIRFADERGPVIKTHFRGHARALNDRAIASLALTQPAMTAKVIAAIHWEALKLYVKGVPLVQRRPGPGHAVSLPR